MLVLHELIGPDVEQHQYILNIAHDEGGGIMIPVLGFAGKGQHQVQQCDTQRIKFILLAVGSILAGVGGLVAARAGLDGVTRFDGVQFDF